jgi:hypothetical protein
MTEVYLPAQISRHAPPVIERKQALTSGDKTVGDKNKNSGGECYLRKNEVVGVYIIVALAQVTVQIRFQRS